MTTLIHRPLQHFREVLKLIILLASHCQPNSEECQNFTSVISALQTTYREITVNEGLMEPLGEGRPLLTLQDLEARLVFTKCKPFVLAVPGRQWIFGIKTFSATFWKQKSISEDFFNSALFIFSHATLFARIKQVEICLELKVAQLSHIGRCYLVTFCYLPKLAEIVCYLLPTSQYL